MGLAAEREIPIVARIAWGSLKNKIIYLLPAGMALSIFAPWLLTPILMIGGLYLCFEGYEKVHSMFAGGDDGHAAAAAEGGADSAKDFEDAKVAGAIRTTWCCLLKSWRSRSPASSSPTRGEGNRAGAVAFFVTAGVYGAVA